MGRHGRTCHTVSHSHDWSYDLAVNSTENCSSCSSAERQTLSHISQERQTLPQERQTPPETTPNDRSKESTRLALSLDDELGCGGALRQGGSVDGLVATKRNITGILLKVNCLCSSCSFLSSRHQSWPTATPPVLRYELSLLQVLPQPRVRCLSSR